MIDLPHSDIIKTKGQLFVPTNEFLNYSDKARKASDSANLASISSSSANVDSDLDVANQKLGSIDTDLDTLATLHSDLSAISGKLDTIITLITPASA